jgi:hypothetical protein
MFKFRNWEKFVPLRSFYNAFNLPFCSFCWQVRLLYKGTLRVLLVLLHDFPEFLCDHHFTFCDVIPPSCIQMRNLILSAFPRNMRLPDPFTPNLKVSHLHISWSLVCPVPSFRPIVMSTRKLQGANVSHLIRVVFSGGLASGNQPGSTYSLRCRACFEKQTTEGRSG